MNKPDAWNVGWKAGYRAALATKPAEMAYWKIIDKDGRIAAMVGTEDGAIAEQAWQDENNARFSPHRIEKPGTVHPTESAGKAVQRPADEDPVTWVVSISSPEFAAGIDRALPIGMALYAAPSDDKETPPEAGEDRAFPDDLAFLKGRVRYWTDAFEETLRTVGVKHVISFAAAILSNRDSADRYESAGKSPEAAGEAVYHLRSYGDVSKAELDYYETHGTLAGFAETQRSSNATRSDDIDPGPQDCAPEPDAFLFHYRKIGGGRRYTIASLPEQTDWGHPDPEAGFEYVSKEPLYATPSIAQRGAALTDERAAFEKWAAEHLYASMEEKDEESVYRFSVAQDCWNAWQARAALSPERPD